MLNLHARSRSEQVTDDNGFRDSPVYDEVSINQLISILAQSLRRFFLNHLKY